MANTLSKGTLFPEELIPGMMNKVVGKSSLAKLSGQTPVSFVGNDIFTFSMDAEVNLVGENEEKPAGGVTVAPVKVVPVKVEYGARVSDEFMHTSEEKRIELLQSFVDGYAKKLARGLDIMGFHGFNPRTGAASSLIKSHMGQVSKTVTYTAATPDANVEDAVALLGDHDITGIAMSRPFATALAKETDANGVKLYPQLAWGGQPNEINGLNASINSTVDFGSATDEAIIGDFENCFRWGYAKDIPMEVIEYGDPDGTGKDLKHYNQVYLRCETYIGMAVLDADAFVRIVD